MSDGFTLTLYQFILFHTGTREYTSSSDLSDILPEDVEAKVKEAAEISMGTEISEDDIKNIQHLCDQVSMSI
jgi:nucleolar protein 58